jgi:4'-phosphopantetheinyl transferase EntD
MDNSTSTNPRLKAQIDQEYTQRAAELGASVFEKSLLEARIQSLHAQMEALNHEAFLAKEAESKATAPEVKNENS